MKHRKWILTTVAGVSLAAFLFTGCQSSQSEIDSLKAQVDLLQDYIEVNMKADLDNWDGSYVGTGDQSIHPIYDDTAVVEAYRSGDSSGLSEEDLYTLETAAEIIEQLGITNKMSDFEKEKAIYDWQFAYTQYDSTQQSAIPQTTDVSEYNYYPYGVLKYHSAICVGNATTFKLFMDMLGIDCQIIHSTTQGEHAWNLVNIDGDWYHLDLTFDGGSNGIPAYSYFNVTDAIKQNGGYPWDASEFPAATATKYCMAVVENQEVDDLYAVPQLIKTAIDEGKNHLFVSIKDNSVLDYSLLDIVNSTLVNNYVYTNYTYSLEDGTVIYNIYIDTYEAVPDTTEDPNFDYEKMQDIVYSLFYGEDYIGGAVG